MLGVQQVDNTHGLVTRQGSSPEGPRPVGARWSAERNRAWPRPYGGETPAYSAFGLRLVLVIQREQQGAE